MRLAYLVPPFLWLAGARRALVLAAVAEPATGDPADPLREQNEGRALNQALKRTGRLHLVFGVLFAISLWLP